LRELVGVFAEGFADGAVDGGGIQGLEVRDVESGQEVFLGIPHPVFHASFGIVRQLHLVQNVRNDLFG